MGKKVEKQTKKTAANKNTQEPEQTIHVAKQSKKAKSSQLSLLPESLQTRFQEFSDLYQEINKSIAESGKGDSFDVTQRQTELAQKIQDAITLVFKDQISSAEEEIRNTQGDIRNQIESLENSYDKVRGILEQTKAFSGQEITSTLAVLEGKVNEKKTSLQAHQNLLDKARDVYA